MPLIEVAVWVHVERRRLLAVRPFGADVWFLPGGLIESSEAPAEAAAREATEEVGVVVDTDALELLLAVETEAYGRPGTTIVMSCFTGPATGVPSPLGEIESLAYITTGDRSACAPAVQLVVDDLRRQNLID